MVSIRSHNNNQSNNRGITACQHMCASKRLYLWGKLEVDRPSGSVVVQINVLGGFLFEALWPRLQLAQLHRAVWLPRLTREGNDCRSTYRHRNPQAWDQSHYRYTSKQATKSNTFLGLVYSSNNSSTTFTDSRLIPDIHKEGEILLTWTDTV